MSRRNLFVLLRALCPAALLLPLGAWAAASSGVVVAAGDCHDPDLIGLTRQLDDVLAPGKGRSRWLTPDQVADRLAPTPHQSVEEIRRQLDAAREAFYAGEYLKAEEMFAPVRDEITALPPGKIHANLLNSLRLSQALVWMHTGHASQVDEAFRAVLRLTPNYQLDPVYYSPQTRVRFERIRKELAQSPTKRLTVTSKPSGAEVSLDGLIVGKTPYSGDLPAGRYQLQLSREGARSFPRTVELTDTVSMKVDLGFESSVDLQRVPCVQSHGDEKERLAGASRLGAALDSDEAVVLQVEHGGGGQAWLTATLLGLPGGQKVREGSLKVQDLRNPPDGLRDLASFLQTGRVAGNVITGRPAAPLVVATAAPPAQANLAPRADPHPMVEEQAGPPDRRWQRPWGIGIGSAGAVAALVGGYFELSAHKTWSDFDAYYAGGAAPQPSQASAVANLRDSAESKQRIGAAGLITGLVAMGVGGYLYFTAPPRQSGPEVAPTPNGGAVKVDLP